MSPMPEPRRTLWPYVPAAMLVAMVGGLVLLARIAADDPGFAVERDYYKKAVAWDAHQLQQRENARLGWRLEVETRRAEAGRVALVARLLDGHGRGVRAVKLDVEAFHNARAANVLSARLRETDAGYLAELPMQRQGLWELRFTATRGADRFTQVVRADLRETVQ